MEIANCKVLPHHNNNNMYSLQHSVLQQFPSVSLQPATWVSKGCSSWTSEHWRQFITGPTPATSNSHSILKQLATTITYLGSWRHKYADSIFRIYIVVTVNFVPWFSMRNKIGDSVKQNRNSAINWWSYTQYYTLHQWISTRLSSTFSSWWRSGCPVDVWTSLCGRGYHCTCFLCCSRQHHQASE